MGAVKNYFREQFRWRMVYLNHDDPSDFYIACWQKNKNPLPLLLVRSFLFLFCHAIIITSLALNVKFGIIGYWIIYMTHWGLVLITVATGCATLASAMVYFGKPVDINFGLPWSMKLFWITYNVSLTMAFLITVFYYAFLSGLVLDEAYNQYFALDVFSHAMNSVLMLALLATSRVPARLLHVYQPVAAALVYMLFSIVYYYTGGTDFHGNRWVYPMLDWSSPATTAGMVVGVALLMLLIHAAVVVLTVTRNILTKTQHHEHGSTTVIDVS